MELVEALWNKFYYLEYVIWYINRKSLLKKKNISELIKLYIFHLFNLKGAFNFMKVIILL